MKVVADENIPYATEAYSCFGEVTLAAGRAIDTAMLADADALIVRSITKVNAALLEGTPVKFVGTCTIGEDHIDKAYLAERGIGFSSAPGCNANSVGQYIVAALLVLAEKHGLDLANLSLGIVGVGNVGRRVLAKARALGVRCVLNDPPLAESTADPAYRPLEELFDCDIITLHVPLEKEGPHWTRHLASEAFLGRMKNNALLINSSRGAVVDNQALKTALNAGKLRGAVLDVWEGEPNLDPDMLDAVDIATPHIAGYSYDGKINGTRQIHEACAAHFGQPHSWDPAPLLPPPECPELTLDGAKTTALDDAVRAVYDIREDDAGLRGIKDVPEADRGAYFDRLRKQYRQRREFFNTEVTVSPKNGALEATLDGVGFQVFK